MLSISSVQNKNTPFKSQYSGHKYYILNQIQSSSFFLPAGSPPPPQFQTLISTPIPDPVNLPVDACSNMPRPAHMPTCLAKHAQACPLAQLTHRLISAAGVAGPGYCCWWWWPRVETPARCDSRLGWRPGSTCCPVYCHCLSHFHSPTRQVSSWRG